MSGYTLLTEEDKARIIAQVKGSQLSAERLLREAEETHFRATVMFAAGIVDEAPAPLEVPVAVAAALEFEQKIGVELTKVQAAIDAVEAVEL